MSTATLATLIKTRREALGLKQGELAAAVGTSPAYMSQIEKGKSSWPQNLVVPLAKTLGVSEVEMAIAAGILSPNAARDVGRGNPFPPSDPRWQLIVKLQRIDITDAGADFVVKAMGQLLDLYLTEDELFIGPMGNASNRVDDISHVIDDE